MDGPLKDYKILDLTMYLAGPLASMYLGDLGADVIKVEPPVGDQLRKAGPPFYEGGDSAYYMAGGRNKRCMCIDLKTDAGRELFLKLAADADVVLENFRPGVMEKLGIGYEVLKKINPEMIYAGLSGFGETGPHRELPAFDHILQAYSGWMSITGTEESGPLRPGPSIADLLGGIHTGYAITLALLHRERTGKGQKVTVSLLDGMVSTLFPQILSFLADGEIPKRAGNMHPIIVPFGSFETADGLMNVAVGTVPQWRALCDELGAPEFGDNEEYHTNEGRSKHRDEIHGMIAKALVKKPRAQWLELFAKYDIPCAPVNDLRDVYEDPQVQHNNMFIEMDHPLAGKVKVLNNPLRVQQMSPKEWTPPPARGENTRDILGEYGLSGEEIDALYDKKIVA